MRKSSTWFDVTVFALIPIMAAIAGVSVPDGDPQSPVSSEHDTPETHSSERTADLPVESHNR